MKFFTAFILLFFISSTSYSQKEIIKNGQKINKLDKKNKKQGSWFFFDRLGDLALSCYYENDSIIKPMVFYHKNDSAFVRYPKVEKEEIFLLKSSNNWIIGNLITEKADSTKIEILGRYKRLPNDAFDIEEDSLVSNSPNILKEVEYWSNKEIQPLYMFDNEEFKNFEFRQFSSTNTMFNKKFYADVVINESGKVESVNFPRKTNNLSPHEESELSYMYSQMERWQPFFLKNKTYRCTLNLTRGSTVKPLLGTGN
jgi:hypothetical protein